MAHAVLDRPRPEITGPDGYTTPVPSADQLAVLLGIAEQSPRANDSEVKAAREAYAEFWAWLCGENE